MAKWKYRLDLKDIWHRASDRVITAQETGKLIAERIKALPCFEQDFELQNIHEEFDSLTGEDEWDNFDLIMSCLYDWGDTQIGGKGFWDAEKQCWIATAF